MRLQSDLPRLPLPSTHPHSPVWNNLPVPVAASTPHDFFLLACVGGTVLLLLILIAKMRLHASIALAIAGLTLGVASGMPLRQVPLSFAGGVGNMMGHIAIILGMGAILGRLLSASGGASALGEFLFERCGPIGLPWALMGMGIVVGMPVFLEVGLVLLMPVIAAAARRSARPPPRPPPPPPAPMLSATAYPAALGRTILWGVFIGLPAAAVAGPILTRLLLRHWKKHKHWLPAAGERAPIFGPTAHDDSVAHGAEEAAANPAAGPVPAPVGPLRAIIAILMPVALICLGSWADALTAPGSVSNLVLHFVGSADVAMLLAVLAAMITLGGHIQTGRHHGTEMLRRLTAESFEPIAGVFVILAAAGGLSGVLRDS